MADFGGPEPFTTWDGEPGRRDRPHGATIVVASLAPSGWRYLLLHRAHRGPAWEGDWAWTPPAGSRKPDEAVTACATRELLEETGLRAVDWVTFAEAGRRLRPAALLSSFLTACEASDFG